MHIRAVIRSCALFWPPIGDLEWHSFSPLYSEGESASFDIMANRWYIGSMKTKTSITISNDILKLVDELVEGENRRSAFIEEALTAYLEVVKRHKRDRRDLALINRLSDKLNREASDVLEFQKEMLQ
jgi:hypothetical protein